MTVALKANASTIHLLGWVMHSAVFLRSAFVWHQTITDISYCGLIELLAARFRLPRKAHMEALVLTDYKRLELLTMEYPKPSFGELLIAVRACGICGSDVHGYDGSTGRRRPLAVMGHEAEGLIKEVGNGVVGFAAGDRVTFDSTVYCGRCYFCMKGQI